MCASLFVAPTVHALTEYPPDQAKVNNFYAYDNTVYLTINLSDETWDTIKTEQPTPPEPGNCARIPVDSKGEIPNRYTWRPAGTVTVTDSKGTTNATFTSGVEISKRSYCGSLTTKLNEKPSLKLKFESYTAVQKMGLQYLHLLNSKQDTSYIRQTLGYYLIGMAGLPHPRANYAKVRIVTPTKTEDLVYVNVEPIRGSLIGNPDNGFANRTITQSGSSDANAPGDLYELEASGSDFNADSLQYIGLEKISKVRALNKPDLTYAADQISTRGMAGLQDVINLDQFARFWAMEVLLKHWDGYTMNRNNTYVYNDAIASGGAQNAGLVDFKFIISGIDQILQPERNFIISDESVIGKLMHDSNMYDKFISQVESIRLNVFSREKLDGVIKDRIDTLRSQLIGLGIDTTSEIDTIRIQLKLARAAAIMLSGSGSSAFYIADKNTGDVMHASNTEMVNNYYYEVYHRASLNEASDRWIQSWISSNQGSGQTLISEAYNRALYATATFQTPAGHYYVLTEPQGNWPMGEIWQYEYDVNSRYSDGKLKEFPATVKVKSSRTGRYLHFSGTDMTPQGRPRVYQGDATSLFMY
jgi:hypothetical protein